MLTDLAEIWTTYLPSRTTQFTLVFEPEFRGNPASLYMKSGWILDERYLESGPSSGSSIALINDDLFGRLMWAYVTYDGELLPASSDVPGFEEPLITVLCMAVFLTDPSDEAVTEYQSEFVKFSAAVSQCLITGDTEEELATQ